MNLQFKVRISRFKRNFIAIDRFEITAGKITFLFGESGIGKSIISHAIYGLLDPTRLTITLNDLPYREYLNLPQTRLLKEHGFFVFQEPSTHLNPLLKLNEQLEEGSLRRIPQQDILGKLWDTEDTTVVNRILKVYPKPYRPSGGEKQRILLTMAFKKIRRLQQTGSRRPGSLFIFDEPTGSLDNHFRNIFLKLLLKEYRRFPFTVLFITHDYSIISEIYNRHQDLAPRIEYKELARENDRLLMKEFVPEKYLDWLNTAQSQPPSPPSPANPLLRIASGYQVFGKKMIFSRQPEGQDSCPLEIHSGAMIYLKAASGAGKTTLAKIIMGLQRCRYLQMIVGNWKFTDQTRRSAWRHNIWGKKIGMVFQHADEALNLKATVKEVFGGLPLSREITASFIKQQLSALFDMEIDEAFLKKKVALLSGGQKQRLNLLRTLLLDSEILILDEPLNGLDFFSIQKVIALLRQKQTEGKAILMISHNEEIFDALVPDENVYYLREA